MFNEKVKMVLGIIPAWVNKLRKGLQLMVREGAEGPASPVLKPGEETREASSVGELLERCLGLIFRSYTDTLGDYNSQHHRPDFS